MILVRRRVNILVLVLLMIFTSCKVYRLKQNDSQWQPYKKGDILIFEGSNGNIDTITVKKSNTRNFGTINPYSIFTVKHQVNSSRGELNNEKPTIVQSRPILFKRHISLVSIYRKNDSAYIGFSEYKSPANFDIYIPIKEMNMFKYKDNLHGECFRIINIDSYRIGDFNGKLNSLLFSKKYGYLKVEFKDSSYVSLKKFLRKGKNLL